MNTTPTERSTDDYELSHRLSKSLELLKEFRSEFIRWATVESKGIIPSAFLNESDELKGAAGVLELVFHSHTEKISCIFKPRHGQEKLSWTHYERYCLDEYERLLFSTWSYDTGFTLDRDESSEAVWYIDDQSTADRLEDITKKVSKILNLVTEPKGLAFTAACTIGTVKNQKPKWKPGRVDWSYIKELDKRISDLEDTLERLSASIETKHENKPVKKPLEAIAEEDQQLFLQIAIDIKRHSERYRDAGKWLDDEFYDIESFWQRKELHYRYLLGTIAHDVDEFASVLGDEYDEEAVFWSAMIEAKVFRPISTLRLICNNKIKELLKKGEDVKSGITLSTECEFTKVRFLDEGISKEIEDTLEDLKDLDNGVQKKYRLLDALNDLLVIRRFVSAENSRRIMLVTWLLTDPDAHKVGLNLTQFENWLWSILCEKRQTGLEILDWGRCEVFSLLSENKPSWIALLRKAWDKIKAEKEYPAETKQKIELGKELPELTDTESNILEALSSDTLTGPKLFKKAGYDNSSHYRQILSNLVKRQILGRNSKGYYALKPDNSQ